MRAALKAAGKPSEIHVYPDAPHAFHADYRPSYRQEAAEDGWRRMLDWFKRPRRGLNGAARIASEANVHCARREFRGELARVLEERSLRTVFQPIFGFREGRIIGYEALVRGPEGSTLQTPASSSRAAAEQGVAIELNILCVQEILRAFAARELAGSLFLNVSPRLIARGGFDQERAARFLDGLGIEPGARRDRAHRGLSRRSISATCTKSLMLYRSMGLPRGDRRPGRGIREPAPVVGAAPRVREGRQAFRDGHLRRPGEDAVPARDPAHRREQRLAGDRRGHRERRRLQDGEGDRHRLRPGLVHRPARGDAAPEAHARGASSPSADARVPVAPAARLRAGTEPTAHDFVRAVDPAAPQDDARRAARRFARIAFARRDSGHGRGRHRGRRVARAGSTWRAAAAVAQALRARASHRARRSHAHQGRGGPRPRGAHRDPRRIGCAAPGRRLRDPRERALPRHGLEHGRDAIVARLARARGALHESAHAAAGPGADQRAPRPAAGRARSPFTAWLVEIDQMRGFNDARASRRAMR